MKTYTRLLLAVTAILIGTTLYAQPHRGGHSGGSHGHHHGTHAPAPSNRGYNAPSHNTPSHRESPHRESQRQYTPRDNDGYSRNSQGRETHYGHGNSSRPGAVNSRLRPAGPPHSYRHRSDYGRNTYHRPAPVRHNPGYHPHPAPYHHHPHHRPVYYRPPYAVVRYYGGHRYYYWNNRFYRYINNAYYYCRPPIGYVFSPIADIAYTACRFVETVATVAACSAVAEAANTSTRQQEIINEQNEIIARQNEIIAESNNALVAASLGLTQSTRKDNCKYYYNDGAFYMEKDGGKFEVVTPPAGAIVDTLPEGYETETIDGIQYYKVDNTIFRVTVDASGKPAFEVLGQKNS